MTVAHEDARLPGLAVATNDSAMGATLATLLGADHDERVPSAVHRVLKHTTGKRCVIDYTVATGTGRRRVIGKLYRGDRGQALFGFQAALWGLAGREGAGFGMAEPLAYLAPLGMVLQAAVPGTELASFDDHADWAGALGRVADNLAQLHRLPAVIGARRSLADLIARQCRPGPDGMAASGSPSALEAAALADRLRGADPGAGACIVHGDLGLSQVFDDGSRALFVDFDGACVAPPALDVANFLVSVRGRLGERATPLEDVFLSRYLAAAPDGALSNLPLYFAFAYFRRAMIAHRRAASGHETRVAALLESSEEYLNESD